MNFQKTNIEWVKYLQLMQERPHLFLPNPDYCFVTSENEVIEFEAISNRTIGVLYESCDNILLADLILHNGQLLVYERLVPMIPQEHILAIPIFNDNFLLFQKFHHGIRTYQTCFPHGFMKIGYTAKEYAIKLIEDTLGKCVVSTLYLGNIDTNDNLYNTSTAIFAVKIENIIQPNTYIHHIEHSTICELTEKTFHDFIHNQYIKDSYTIAAYAMYCNTKELYLQKNKYHAFFTKGVSL